MATTTAAAAIATNTQAGWQALGLTAQSFAAATVGTNQVYDLSANSGATSETMSVVSVDTAGNTTSTVYTATGASLTGNFQADAEQSTALFTGVTFQTTVTPAKLANTTTSSITSTAGVANVQALTASFGSVPTVTTPQVLLSTGAGTDARAIVNSVDANGNMTSTTYTALDATGNAIALTGTGVDDSLPLTMKAIASFAVSTTVTPAATASSNSVSSTSTVSDTTTLANLKTVAASTLTTDGTLPAAGSFTATYGNNVNTYQAGTANAAGQLQVQSVDASGNQTTTTYTALDANGNQLTGANSFANASEFAAATTTTFVQSGLLTQGGIDLTTLGTSTGTGTTITAANAAAALAAVNSALSAVTTYAATIGATQDRMTAASTFNSALSTNYANGVAGLVNADMNTASTRLQALQTQEQLGIQSLSIANQNSQLILKLFQ